MPHPSTVIPRSVREGIVLDDHALDAEVAAMTDAHTDLLARRMSERVRGPRPWSFVNRLSRLVVDPERFPDEREVMNSAGMGAVYTHTSTGKRLRTDSSAHQAELIATLFEPYSRALAGVVDDRRDDRVSSLMLELRRDAYLRSDGTPIEQLVSAAAHTVERSTPHTQTTTDEEPLRGTPTVALDDTHKRTSRARKAWKTQAGVAGASRALRSESDSEPRRWRVPASGPPATTGRR